MTVIHYHEQHKKRKGKSAAGGGEPPEKHSPLEESMAMVLGAVTEIQKEIEDIKEKKDSSKWNLQNILTVVLMVAGFILTNVFTGLDYSHNQEIDQKNYMIAEQKLQLEVQKQKLEIQKQENDLKLQQSTGLRAEKAQEDRVALQTSAYMSKIRTLREKTKIAFCRNDQFIGSEKQLQAFNDAQFNLLADLIIIADEVQAYFPASEFSKVKSFSGLIDTDRGICSVSSVPDSELRKIRNSFRDDTRKLINEKQSKIDELEQLPKMRPLNN